MKFEIVYSSKTGSTERVAHALAETLSSNQCRLGNIDGSSARENLQQLYVFSQNHPDEQDLQNAREFLRNVL